MAVNGTNWLYVKFSNNHRGKIIHMALMALDKIPQGYRTGTKAQSQTTQEWHIFTLPPSPSITDEHEGTTISSMAITIIATMTNTTLDISYALEKVKVKLITDGSVVIAPL